MSHLRFSANGESHFYLSNNHTSLLIFFFCRWFRSLSSVVLWVLNEISISQWILFLNGCSDFLLVLCALQTLMCLKFETKIIGIQETNEYFATDDNDVWFFVKISFERLQRRCVGTKHRPTAYIDTLSFLLYETATGAHKIPLVHIRSNKIE